jgi:hypothetical protein
MPKYLGMLFALVLMVLAPLAVAAHYAELTAVRDLLFVGFALILPMGLLGLMVYRILSPRMVDYDTRTALLVNVAPEFAEAIEGRKLPGLPGLSQPARAGTGSGPNWLLIGGVCGGLAVVMLSCGGMVLVASALSRASRGANAAQLKADADRRIAEMQASAERMRAENEAHRQRMIAERVARTNNWPTPPATNQPASPPPVPPSPPPAPPPAADVPQFGSGTPPAAFPPTGRGGFDPRSRMPRPGMAGASSSQEQREEFRPGRSGQFPPDSQPATDTAPLQAGQRVWVKWGGTWYRSIVLSAEPQAARVHYLGWSDSFDTSTPLGNIRVLTEAGAPPSTASGRLPPLSRTWTDATGQFKVDAEFVEMQGNVVVLKKADGATVRIPLDKLSAEDQRIAQELK